MKRNRSIQSEHQRHFCEHQHSVDKDSSTVWERKAADFIDLNREEDALGDSNGRNLPIVFEKQKQCTCNMHQSQYRPIDTGDACTSANRRQSPFHFLKNEVKPSANMYQSHHQLQTINPSPKCRLCGSNPKIPQHFQENRDQVKFKSLKTE